MDKTISSILDFLSDISAKKVATILFLLFLLSVGLVVYERLTDSSALRKIEKANTVLIDLEKSKNLTPEQSQSIETLRTALLERLEETLENDRFSLVFSTSKITVSLDGLLKFMFGGLAFFIAAVVLAIKSAKDPSNRETALGFGLLGCIFGGVGVFIPQIWWPWFHIFIVPIALLTLIVALVIILGATPDKKKPNQNLEPIVTTPVESGKVVFQETHT